jgi:hypothetical protein
MRPAEIQVKINVLQREMDFWRGVLADKRCGNCMEWDGQQCDKYKATPPQGLKEPGCEEWSWDSIPF